MGEELVRSDRGRGWNSPCLGVEIIDLSKFGRGTDNSLTGGGGGRVSFDFMRPSRLMEGLNVVMALSGLLRAPPAPLGVVASVLPALGSLLLCQNPPNLSFFCFL